MSLRDRLARQLAARTDSHSPVGRALRWIHHHLPRRVPDRPIAQVIAAFAATHPTATFAQVGAHDGTQLDPLRDEILRRRWRGVMVEPVPYVFNRLVSNYGSVNRVAFENAAIGDIDGTREFFYLRERADDEQVWRWYDALGSFRRDVLLSHAEQIPDIAERVVSSELPCLTFATLCEKHGLTHVDLVQMDTEGYDYEVVRRIDLDGLGVKVVMYENLHLDADTREACEELLRGHGFELISDGMDTLAVRRAVLDEVPALGRLWGRLEAEAS